jgi:uncharacterized protein (DUF1778 family)
MDAEERRSIMPRLSIDITEQQHQQLKISAALTGQSIKGYVLSRAFRAPQEGDALSEEQALLALHDFLEQRLQQVRNGETVSANADDIKSRARALRDGGV